MGTTTKVEINNHKAAMSLEGCTVKYFGLSGRAEAIRLALHIAGVKFTDQRLTFAEWGAHKEGERWGTPPAMTLADGTRLGQSYAMARYVGEETGLFTFKGLAAQKVMELIFGLEDLTSKTNAIGRGLEAGEEKNALRAAAVAPGGECHAYALRFEAFLAQLVSEGVITTSDITLPHLIIFSSIGFLVSGFYDGVPPTAFQDLPTLSAVRQAVAGHAVVGKYYDELKAYDLRKDVPAK